MAESGIDTGMDIDDLIPKSPERHAEEKKEHGNHLYKLKDYKGALTLYEEAINLCPENAAFYGNRSACFMMLGNYNKAYEDAQKAVQLDPNFTKGYVRTAKCCIALGDTLGAEYAIKRATALGGSGVVSAESTTLEAIKRLSEEAEKAQITSDNRRIVYCMDRILDSCPASIKVKLKKAECLALLGRYQEAQEIASDSLRFDKVNPDAIYVRGVCLYYQDNVEQAFKHFQQVLRLAPDHQKAIEIYKKAKLLKQKKEEGNEAFKMGKWQDAYNLYGEALKIDPHNKTVNAKLFFNKATVCAKINRLKEAVDACTSALALDDTYLKALLRRAKCYSDLGDHEDAVKDYERAVKMDKSKENKHLLHEAKAALKRSKRKDYYKILGIDKNASVDEIKRAYKKRAMVHHPDRHAGAPNTEKLEQEKRFKEVGEAYGVLSDSKKRARYDHGQDLDDSDGLSHDIDPNTVFQAFFAGATPGCNNQYGGFQGSGFQNGFTFQFG